MAVPRLERFRVPLAESGPFRDHVSDDYWSVRPLVLVDERLHTQIAAAADVVVVKPRLPYALGKKEIKIKIVVKPCLP